MTAPTSLRPGTRDAAAPLDVVVAVPTYCRPQAVSDLLPLLADQARGLAGDVARILVVDGDPDGSARPVVEAFTTWGGRAVRVDYVHDPAPGLDAARNAALAEAATADLLVLLEDDLVPTRGWLERLVAAYREHPATAIAGPVEPCLARTPSAWVQAGEFFRRRSLPTGTSLDVASTNNLLLDVVAARRLGLHFDERFGLAGVSDTLFTRRLVAEGGRLAWCDEAVVVEQVPAHRVSLAWALRRVLLGGNAWGRVAVRMEPGHSVRQRARRARARTAMTTHGVARTVGGAGRALAGLAVLRPREQALGVRVMTRGLGMVAGAWGWSYTGADAWAEGKDPRTGT